MKPQQNKIERYLKKHALSQGVYVKTIDMPLKLFIRLVKQWIFPSVTLEDASRIIAEAVDKCGALYEDTRGIAKIRLEDSNMPGLTDHNFDEFNSYMLNEIMERYDLSEREQNNLILRLSMMIENVADSQTQVIAN